MPVRYKRILFIINKYSGKGFQPQMEGKIIDACRDNDVECTLEFTKSRGHATLLAQQGVAENFDCIVAIGGDGTVNEVARGLVHTHLPLGIIPKGSGNGLARHLGIPLSYIKAIEALFVSEPLRIDTFTINERLSLNVSGIGFDGHIANHFGKDGKRGLAGYTKLAVEEYLKFTEFESVVSANGEKMRKKAFIIAIANSSQYGNNARIAPQASVCDQKLHVTILNKIPPYRLDFIYDFFNGKIDRSIYSEVFDTDALRIEPLAPMEYHVDGEPCGIDSSFDIALQPLSLSVLVPPNRRKKI